MKSVRLAALCCAIALLGASCSRSSNTSTTSSSSGSSVSSSSSANGDTALANGGFGDLAKVCQAGDAKGATDTGVTDTDIHIGTITDKGAQVRPELDREMYDAAVAFAAWCNDHGGILGRKLVIDDRDSKLFEYQDRLRDSCPVDLALVGGGSPSDDDPGSADAPDGVRIACGLPNIPGYVVSPRARVAKLQVQPVPNPVYQLQSGAYTAMDKAHPGALQSYGILWASSIASIKTVHDADVEAIKNIGGNVVYDNQYPFTGPSVTEWAPYVQEMKDKGVKMLEFVGEPVNLENLQQAMQTAGWNPDVTLQTTNFYDSKYLAEGGKAANNTWIRSSFTPFELAAQNKATQDYLDLMKQYNPSGKVALLGAQATSALLLFAKAATDCGSQLTRTCLLDNASKVTNWTGGGLHAATNPAQNTPPDCFVLLKVATDKFVVDSAATAANNGIFNCSPGNVIELHGDYGVPH